MFCEGEQNAEQIWFGTTKNLFDYYELVSCFCPKPYLILGIKSDEKISDIFCYEGAEKVYRKEKEFYKLFGEESNLRLGWIKTHGGIDFAKAVAGFFVRVFYGKKENLFVDGTNFRCTKTGCVADEFDGARSVFEQNRAEFVEKKTNSVKNKLLESIFNNREKCSFDLKHLKTECVEGMNADIIMWFSQKRMTCYGVLFKPEHKKEENLPVTICLWEGGTDKITDNIQKIKEITKNNKAAFVADLTAMGKCSPVSADTRVGKSAPVVKLNNDLLLLGDSICALRAYDILKTLDMLKEEFGTSDFELFTVGDYSVYPEILSIIGRKIKSECVNPVNVHDIITNKYYDDSSITNILMYGLGLYLK